MELWQCVGLAALGVALGALGFWLLKLKTSSEDFWGRRRTFGYSVWVYRNGRWEMTEDRSKPGYVPGSAPPVPGEFEDEFVQVISVPRS